MTTTVNRFIRKDLPRIDGHQAINVARSYLTQHGAVMVVMENKPVGLLTAADLVTRQHNLVIDSIVPRQAVYPEQTIREVLEQMKFAHTETLPVCDTSNVLLGAVYKDDLVDYLCDMVDKQHAAVQSMAHDLKSPLANILSINELLQQEITQIENRQLLTYSSKSCDMATEIINDVLITEMMETESANFTMIELSSFLETCLQDVSGLISQKMIALKSQLLVRKYYFRGDKAKLRRAIHNILSNSIKFTRPKGVIQVSCTAQLNSFTVIVEDNGIGIPVHMQPHVFDKFSSARRKGTSGESSTGLGMYITKEIIELHNGEIWFESPEKGGTRFFIRIHLNSK